MAKGNMFLGMSRGSVGDVTFYRGRGQQLARARNRSPKNPRSAAQLIQRMILSTASKAYSRMKSIVDHSFENVAYGGPSQSYFLKKALEQIRAFVTANYPEMSETVAARVVGLAQPDEMLGNALYGIGLPVSEGSLPSIQPRISESAETAGVLLGFGDITYAGENPTIAEVLSSIGAAVGDQITICGISQTTGAWLQSRYVINSEATAAQLAAVWDPTGLAEAFDREKTLVGGVQLLIDEDLMKASVPMWGYTIILSRKSSTKWLRSTQSLIYSSDMGDYPDVDTVIGLWLEGSSSLDLPSSRFLNNAELGE